MSDTTPDNAPDSGEYPPLARRPDRQTLWRWAEGIMNGSGASMRSAARAAPVLHILTESDEMWCSNGRGMAFVSIRPRYCSACLALCGEMWDDLAEPYDLAAVKVDCGPVPDPRTIYEPPRGGPRSAKGGER